MNNHLSRRKFTKTVISGVAATILVPLQAMVPFVVHNKFPVRLGGPLFKEYLDPKEWVNDLKQKRYSAAYCPVKIGSDDALIRKFQLAAQDSDIRISEVGAWSNPLSSDETERKAAILKCKQSLYLAERIGAGCCVNITGSRGKQWDGPHPDNFREDTFEMIVQITREIIDEVNPSRTYYTLETMPWAFPDSPDSYLDLIKAINRKQLGVHLDPVNLVNSPRRYFNNGVLIEECFKKLGPYIKNCHAKDIILRDELTVHLEEVLPGTGGLDYKIFLREISKLKDVPLMLEHLKTEREYDRAAENVREIGINSGIIFSS